MSKTQLTAPDAQHVTATSSATATDPPPPPPAQDEPEKAVTSGTPVPENHGNTSAVAFELLDRVCGVFGVDPDVNARPRQLLAWSYYPEQPLDGIPAAVVIVTGGGKKLKMFDDPDYPMDQDTEERLADIFNAYTIDGTTKNRVRTNLPGDLTLPLIHVTGVSTQSEHRYQGGYLRSGGKTEAAKRQSERDKRQPSKR